MKIFSFISNFEKDKCRDRKFFKVIHILMTDDDFQTSRFCCCHLNLTDLFLQLQVLHSSRAWEAAGETCKR